MVCIIYSVDKMATPWFISTLRRIERDLSFYEDGRRIGVDVLDAYQVQLEQVYRELVCVEVLGGLRDQAAMGVDLVREALRQVRNMLEGAERLQMGYHAPATHTERRERPSFHIPLTLLRVRDYVVCLTLCGAFCITYIGVGIGGARGAMAPPKILVNSVY